MLSVQTYHRLFYYVDKLIADTVELLMAQGQHQSGVARI